MRYVEPQQPPTQGASPAVWPLVVEVAQRLFVEPHEAEVLGVLVEDMHARDAFGRQRYGVPLQADNQRDHLTDAYQEALDLCAYLKAEEMRVRHSKGTADTSDLRMALVLAYNIRMRLALRDGR